MGGVLALVCEERRTVRATTPRACPAVTADQRRLQSLARAIVTAAEELAPALPQPAAPPPPNPREFFRCTQIGGFGLTGGGPCKAGDLVIRPNATGSGTFPLMRFGETTPVGQVTVGNNNGEITLLRPDANASMASVGGLGTFTRCS